MADSADVKPATAAMADLTVNGEPPKDAEGAKEIDEEKKARKEAKLKEKEAKKERAAAKVAAKAAADAAAASGAGGEKKEKKNKTAALVNAEPEEIKVTPPGEKKDVSGEMPKAYNPKAVEEGWYAWWEKSGFFSANPASTKEKFVMVIPPPNVTGSLHLGHGLTNSIQDTLTRWHRMSGREALWVPGTDHAGIATQTVVEKKIMRDKKLTRHDLGREEFLKQVWAWKEQYGNTILSQLRRLGSSVDWDREVFTMDEKLSKAVLEAFVRMYEQGLIYRDNRLVNWCCTLRTAISDIEVDYITLEKRTEVHVPGYGSDKVEFGAIMSFAYPLEDGSGEIVVATTRLETMLGDTAVAVHPEDPRYKHLHGKFLKHPFVDRRVPIICDAELVDMAFGTGAVKVTPAHDPNDFATGKRHGLEFINVMMDDGLMNANAGQFAGQRRFDARKTVKAALEALGLFRGVADNPMRLGVCSRTKDVIEPLIKPQWYVNCTDMAAKGAAAVREGKLQILPNIFEDVWFRWLDNIRDWCISRQLWWGHRIPAYYVNLEGEPSLAMAGEKSDRWVVGRTLEDANAAAAAKFPGKKFTLEQDPDVLDTWFSSGLFPFSVHGWPEDTPEMRAFYPTTLLETGHDILFFWVARMVMMGITLTGQVPFRQVYLHAMVRDAHGRKMSKSLGNVIDPLEVMDGITLEALHKKLDEGNLDAREVVKAKEGQSRDFPNGIAECGADALRFALVAYTSQARDINLDIMRVVGYRMWCNKLWNAIRFAMMNLGEGFMPSKQEELDVAAAPFACKWILSRINAAISGMVTNMTKFEFSDATTVIYSWFQYELCDVFIELLKPIVYGDDSLPGAPAAKRSAREVLWLCLDYGLRLLHPFMPYVSEELWQRLPRRAEDTAAYPSIMVAPYPEPVSGWDNASVEADMSLLLAVVKETRALRSTYNVPPKMKPEVFVVCSGKQAESLSPALPALVTLASLASATIVASASEVPLGCAIAIVNEDVSSAIQLHGVVDAKVELEKLAKKREEVEKQRDTLAKKMAAKGYEEKVPVAVQEENKAKMDKFAAELEQVAMAAGAFERLLASS
eukprot:jgi/Mesvir1/8714/Mv02646-RA.1